MKIFRIVIAGLTFVWVVFASITTIHALTPQHMTYEDWLDSEVDWNLKHNKTTQDYVRKEVKAVIRMSTNVVNTGQLSKSDKEIVDAKSN